MLAFGPAQQVKNNHVVAFLSYSESLKRTGLSLLGRKMVSYNYKKLHYQKYLSQNLFIFVLTFSQRQVGNQADTERTLDLLHGLN